MPSQDELEYGYFACPSMAGLCDAAQQVYAKGYKLEFWEDTNRVGFIQSLTPFQRLIVYMDKSACEGVYLPVFFKQLYTAMGRLDLLESRGLVDPPPPKTSWEWVLDPVL